ncbi:MAG: STAS domain-containing protein [Bacteroidota bacterium]
MIIEILHEDKTVIKIALSGKLDANNVANEASKFYTLLNSRKRRVIVDLSDVSFLASMGIRMLLTASKDIKRNGYTLKIENAPVEVEKTLVTAGLQDLLV